MKYVDIDGRKHPVKFNMAAFLELEQSTGLALTEIMLTIESNPVILLRTFYLGLKYGADEARKKFDMTYSQFVDKATGNDELQTDLGTIIGQDWKALNDAHEARTESKEPVGEKKTSSSGPTTQE